jgi:hypothetical protein
MRSRMLAKFSNYFLFLTVGFLMLFSPFTGRAQNNSTINLAGTSWNTGTVAIQTSSIDKSVMTLTRYYDFYKQGKVTSTNVIAKSAGAEYKLVLDYVYVGGTVTKYEYRWVWKFVPTMPSSSREILNGRYEVKGTSVYLDFPTYTVSASIYSDSIKGTLTYKESNKKQQWIITRALTQNSSNDENSSYPNYPNVVRNSDGTYHPADGYGWVDPNDPKDFRVEPVLYDPASDLVKILNAVSNKQGTLSVKMNDDSIRKIDLRQAKEMMIESILYDPTPDLLQVNDAISKKRGVLRVEMKDGSVKRIDLSQAKEITVETDLIRAKNPINQ